MITVHLTDTLTGEKKSILRDEEWGDGYRWQEGNLSCDCNRHALFYPETEDVIPCNVWDNRIVLDKVEENGKIVFSRILNVF